MALMARACLANETLAKIVSTRSISLGERSFTNHNKLLWQYEGCIGLKTGYTEKAGRTLVSAARRDGLTLICVTLNAPNDWSDHTVLFDTCFEQYDSTELAEAGTSLCRLPVQGSIVPFCTVTVERSVSAALSESETAVCTMELEKESLSAPVEQGAQVGWAVWTLEGSELAREKLVAARVVPRDRVEPQNLWKRLKTRFLELQGTE